ncbi:phenylacetate--CoA ligase family protein [Xanthocytophaga agilis]|uniref:AMP-binding protein n=1 Tax=Xanthocytophaga agilis TaxID=3048010 RepID=A0AAE3UBT2_9BACT|nr:AMP-binding protein [Xanthocytophaga agilis]MDJ1500158.1 AMP-binding protein [Xanthocytophaga agilis]
MTSVSYTLLEQQQSQLEVLQNQIHYLRLHSLYYRRVLTECQLTEKNLLSIEDIQKFPFTTKADLQKYNKEFLCQSLSKIIDIVSTSGTSGTPVSFYLTDNDLERLATNESQSLSIAGIGPDDIVQLTTTSDRLFMAGLAYVLGLRKLGASLLRVGPGLPDLQWKLIAEHKTTTLIAVPSFILKMLEYAEKNQIDPAASTVNKIVCIGEPIRNQDFSLNILGQKITDKWPVQLYSTYASTEMATAFTECHAGKGGHHLPELVFIEVVDEQDQSVPPGMSGELVITTLGIEGTPLLRFKTGDICQYHLSSCECGRTTLRLGPLQGRKNQMIKYKGTTLYPPALTELLHELDYISAYYSEVTTNEMGLDAIKIYVAGNEKDADLVFRIKEHFQARIRVTPDIFVTSAQEINAIKTSFNFRKPVDFIDRRTTF